MFRTHWLCPYCLGLASLQSRKKRSALLAHLTTKQRAGSSSLAAAQIVVTPMRCVPRSLRTQDQPRSRESLKRTVDARCEWGSLAMGTRQNHRQNATVGAATRFRLLSVTRAIFSICVCTLAGAVGAGSNGALRQYGPWHGRERGSSLDASCLSTADGSRSL